MPAEPSGGARFRYLSPRRWGDLDAQGHVNNAVYLDHLQDARVAFLHAGRTGPGRHAPHRRAGRRAAGRVRRARRLRPRAPGRLDLDRRAGGQPVHGRLRDLRRGDPRGPSAHDPGPLRPRRRSGAAAERRRAGGVRVLPGPGGAAAAAAEGRGGRGRGALPAHRALVGPGRLRPRQQREVLRLRAGGARRDHDQHARLVGGCRLVDRPSGPRAPRAPRLPLRALRGRDERRRAGVPFLHPRRRDPRPGARGRSTPAPVRSPSAPVRSTRPSDGPWPGSRCPTPQAFPAPESRGATPAGRGTPC